MVGGMLRLHLFLVARIEAGDGRALVCVILDSFRQRHTTRRPLTMEEDQTPRLPNLGENWTRTNESERLELALERLSGLFRREIRACNPDRCDEYATMFEKQLSEINRPNEERDMRALVREQARDMKQIAIKSDPKWQAQRQADLEMRTIKKQAQKAKWMQKNRERRAAIKQQRLQEADGQKLLPNQPQRRQSVRRQRTSQFAHTLALRPGLVGDNEEDMGMAGGTTNNGSAAKAHQPQMPLPALPMFSNLQIRTRPSLASAKPQAAPDAGDISEDIL